MHEVEIPRPHAGGIEGESQGFSRPLDLPGPLLDAPFQGLVRDTQPFLNRFAFQDVLACLVLAAAHPNGGGHRPEQRLGIDRPFQQDDVAETLDHRGGLGRPTPGLARRQHDERKVGPGRLGGHPGVYGRRIDVEERFLGHDRCRRRRLQCVEPSRTVGADERRGTGLVQQLRHDLRVASARGQDQNAVLVAPEGGRHHGISTASDLSASIATAPP